MQITVIPYRQELADRWDDFVRHSRNGTIYHLRRFLSYHPPERFQDASLVFMGGDEIVAVLPAAQKEEAGKKVLVSHPGASYGGLVLSQAFGMAETGAVVDALVDHVQKNGYDGCRMLRLTPPMLRRRSSDDQEYWLFQKGWRIESFELASALSLHHGDKVSDLDDISPRARRAVRQAEKSGLVLSTEPDLPSFWPLLEKTLADRYATAPTHSLEEIRRLHMLFPQDIRLFRALHQGAVVGGIVTLNVQESATYTMYFGQDYEQQKLRSMHFLVWNILKRCIEEGRTVLDFGISTERGGSVVNDGLFAFKESFGAFSMRRESWVITF